MKILRETDGARILLVNISFPCSCSIGVCQQKKNVVSKVVEMKVNMEINIFVNVTLYIFYMN